MEQSVIELPVSEKTHYEKYRSKGESFREYANRVASALADRDSDSHFRQFRDGLLHQRLLPAGRIQRAAGSPKNITAYNCFVSGTIVDSFTEGEGSIMQCATEAGQTMRMGGGIGYDFSPIRPRGTPIQTLGSGASGPVSFMQIYDAVCKTIASAGNRRGAQMGVLRIDHPDVEEFVRAKQNTNNLTAFNISLAITDAFMQALKTDTPFQLKWNDKDYGTLNPVALWEEIMRSTWDWAEPGVLFIDTINRMNNLWYCEEIAATNPCGEQPLPPFGACLLGSVNLVKYVRSPAPYPIAIADWKKWIDTELLRADTFAFQRALDNVIDTTCYPLPPQKEEALNKRRMGIGVTGMANALEALGHPYGSDGFLELEAEVLKFQRDNLYLSSVNLAKDKGAFPYYDRDLYMQGSFIKTLPTEVRNAIHKYGIRNSHLTSIAPTGTISLCADNVSSGIEPVFSHSYSRTILEDSGPVVYKVDDYAFRKWNIRGVSAEEATPDQHLAVLATAQKYIDSAVSKTINLGSSTKWADFKRIYMDAYDMGCKGVTTFNSSGKRMGILKVETDEAEPLACYIDPETGERSCEE